MNDDVAMSQEAKDIVRSWLSRQDPQAGPEAIAGLVGDADVVGLGANTRQAHEPFLLVEHTTRVLIDRGFRVVAMLDNRQVGELYDQFVRGEDVDLDLALGQAWGPWRTNEMRDALVWLRHRNEAHPYDPVRIVALSRPHVLPADYGRVAELLATIDSEAAARVGGLLDTVRTAHDSGEHVQRARGTHPGTPFVELARRAHAMAAQLEACSERDDALRLLDDMVEYHANAPGAEYDAEGEERAAAEQLLEWHRRTGDRIVIWEGSAHTAAHRSIMLGSHLSNALGKGYAAVHITFGEGRIGDIEVPPPSPGSLEDLLLPVGDELVVELGADVPAEVARRLDQPWRTRLISGIYDPAHDEDHYYDLPSLMESFDVVAFIAAVTPIRPLEPTPRNG